MKGLQQPAKFIYNTLKLPTLQKLQMQFLQDDSTNNLTREISRQSKFLSHEIQTVSKNKTITLSYDKSKQTLVTQIVLSEKTTKYISNDFQNFDDHKPYCCHEEQVTSERAVTQKIEEVVKMLKDYCKYKEVVIPKEISTEVMIEHSKMYSCMLYTVSAQFRLLPIYSCSLDKLDDLVAEDCKTALNNIIFKQFKKLLKQIITESDILSGLFNLLRNPDFPISRFSNKRKITFLLMLAESIFLTKKKKNKQKKNKQKKQNATLNSDEEDSPREDSCQNIYNQIKNLSNDNSRCPIAVSSEFISNIRAQSRKLAIAQ